MLIRRRRGRWNGALFGLRAGMTLVEVVVTLVIIGVLAAVLVLGTSSRAGGDAARIDRAVFVLARIADATARFAGVGGASSFTQIIGTTLGAVNPYRLSHLTTKILITDHDSCFTVYSSTEAGRWIGPFYLAFFPTAGFKIAEGFFADDTLQRHNPAGVPTRIAGTDIATPGTLAIIMRNVAIADARGLALAVEGDQGGVKGAVRFIANGDAPVTVKYHMNIHGC